MTAITRGEIYVGSTVLHGVINEIVRGFPVCRSCPARVSATKSGRWRSSRARAMSTREEIRRLGTHRRRAEDRPRRQGIRDPDQPGRAAARAVPKLTDIKVIDYDFARYGSRRHAQALARALGEGDRSSAAMSDPRRPLVFWLAVGAIGFLLVPWYALQDSACSRWRGSRTLPERKRHRRCSRSCFMAKVGWPCSAPCSRRASR